jgi:hypothetical protein
VNHTKIRLYPCRKYYYFDFESILDLAFQLKYEWSQFFFAIAVAAAVAGVGASCTGAQNFFAIAVADLPAAAWAIIFLDALYDLW